MIPNEEPGRATRRETKLAVVIVLLSLALHAWVLAARVDLTMDFEELYEGYVASALLENGPRHLLRYQYTSYEGGSLIMGIAAVPFVALFGDHLLVVKIPSLILALAVQFVCFRFLCRRFGGRIALSGRLTWDIDLPVRATSPFDYKLVIVAGDEPVVEAAGWLDQQSDWNQAVADLANRGIIVTAVGHRVVP